MLMKNKSNGAISGYDEKHLHTPILRFNEFQKREPWSEATLYECLDYEQPTPYLVSSSKYSQDHGTPVLTAGKTFILGYTDESYGVFRDGLPVIIFDDFTTATQYVDFPFKAKSSAMKILSAKNGNTVKFMFELMQLLPHEVGAHERHWISIFSKMNVLVPKPDEQQKIADCLSSIDNLIAAHVQKVEALKDHRLQLLQQLFPEQNKMLPRMRFKQFQQSSQWTLKTAGSLFENRVTKGEEGLPIYSVTTHDGMVPRSTIDRNFYDIETASGNKLALKNDIVYNMMRMWQGALGVASEDCLVSPAYIVLRPLEGVDPDFFALLFKLPQMLQLLTAHSRGLTADRLRLYYADFAKIKLMVPSIAEQVYISALMCAATGQITLETQKLKLLRTFKQGLLQRLFPSMQQLIHDSHLAAAFI